MLHPPRIRTSLDVGGAGAGAGRHLGLNPPQTSLGPRCPHEDADKPDRKALGPTGRLAGRPSGLQRPLRAEHEVGFLAMAVWYC
jgi:hypothetical protein